jgi:hypothetical protein
VPLTDPAPSGHPVWTEAIAGVRFNEDRTVEAVRPDALTKLQARFTPSVETNRLMTWAQKLLYELPLSHP